MKVWKTQVIWTICLLVKGKTDIELCVISLNSCIIIGLYLKMVSTLLRAKLDSSLILPLICFRFYVKESDVNF